MPLAVRKGSIEAAFSTKQRQKQANSVEIFGLMIVRSILIAAHLTSHSSSLHITFHHTLSTLRYTVLLISTHLK